MRFLKSNAGWIGLALTITAGVAGLYAKAALAETREKLALVEDRFARHVELQEKRDRLMLQKLDALCRATPKADCPLGVE